MTEEAPVPAASDLLATGCSLVQGRLAQGSAVTVIRALADGHTGADVVLCDVSSGSPGEADGPNGQFILKVERSSSNAQAQAHRDFCSMLGDFADQHVPDLVMAIQGAGVTADLYEVAGSSLNSVRTAQYVDYEDRESTCASAARDLLMAQLAPGASPDYQCSTGQVMQDWLGAAFPENGRGARLRELSRQLNVTGPVFRYDGELLPNPLSLLASGEPLAAAQMPCFRGPVHGDLHLGNLLVRGSRETRNLTYWLIDVGWSEPAPLLYDQAYLELSAFLDGLAKAESGRVLPFLAKWDKEALTVRQELQTSERGLVDLIGRIRDETVMALEAVQPRRSDVWQRQYKMARIAAGLNWAAKPLGNDRLRQAAFVSAAWAARLLLRGEQDLVHVWEKLAQQDRGDTQSAPAVAMPISAQEALERWAPFQARSSGQDLFLVADALPAGEHLTALASCRWAAVIDVDPDSDRDGLAQVVVPALKTLRHVSVFGENRQLTSSASATNWLMANGWHSRSEESAASATEWRRRGYRNRVRQLVEEVVASTPNRAAAVLCLRSGQNDDLVEYIVDYIDEQYDGKVLLLPLAAAPAAEGADLNSFLASVAPSLPLSGIGTTPTIPGTGGAHVLSREDLNRLSVDLEVLHSAVLSDAPTSEPLPDSFWRGRAPTWSELEACVDVPRDAAAALVAELAERLEDRQLAVVELDHSPGAGGTTLARRVAWDLHREHPTVLVRQFSPTTIERIDEIYQHVGRAVLVIAEASDVPESDREELYRGLAQHNSRAVILWINRINVRRPDRHQLIDPVSPEDKGRLLREFRRRANTPQALERLDELVNGDLDSLPSQRLSPFYFGLCVYDAEFQGLTAYVENHLAKLTKAQRAVARDLALVTRYAQIGIPIDLVRRWLGKPAPPGGDYGSAELSELLGHDLRHLSVAENGCLRLLHPLIAEKVLDGDPAGEQFGLSQVAVDFIIKVTDSLGPNSQSTRQLLRDVFVRRSSWNEEPNQREHFSALIEAITSAEGGERVFEELTGRCPDEPHFWNHRGRYHIYRVRGNFGQAEEFLRLAVEKSGRNDPLHLHTLGMVRRFWVESELRALVVTDTATATTAEEALEIIKPRFDDAMAAFNQARSSSTGDHNWVTPVQLIVFVVEQLVRISKSDNLIELLKTDNPVSQWIAAQLDQAEDLLDGLRSAYAEARSRSRFYDPLTNRLDLLYGNLDALIEQWRLLRATSGDDDTMGLALARALYANAGRDLSRLSDGEIREIVQMTDGRVRSGQATSADLRFWFQAYRRLPEFSETTALERFSWFALKPDGLEANYYLYILHFLRWYRGDEHDQDRIRHYQEECRRLGRMDRRQWSYEWLGTESLPYPLIHFSELGERRLEYDNFWSRPYLLRRVSGVIEEIRGPQAGSIRIGNGKLTAFFTPRGEFLQTRDINQLVEFYLGFSYEGCRAWGVTYPGGKPKSLVAAERDQKAAPRPSRAAPPSRTPELDVLAPAEEPPEILPAVPRPPRPKAPRIDVGDVRTIAPQAPAAGPEAYRAVIAELVQRGQAQGVALTSLQLGDVLQARFGAFSYQEFRGGKGKLRGAVEQLGFRTTTLPAGFAVDLP